MRKYIVIVCCLMTTCYTFGQNPWTFRECVDFALKNNIEIKQQDLQVKNAEVNLNSSKNSRLPNLEGGIGQNFSFGRSQSMATGIYEENKASSTNFSLSSGLPIFTGFRIPNQIKSDEMSLKSAAEGLLKVQQDLQMQISSYFLDILFKKEILKVYEEQANLTQTQVDRTQILVDNGKVALSQLFDIKAQYAKDLLNVTTADNDLKTSLLNLAQLLNLRSANDFDIQIPNIDAMFTAGSLSFSGVSVPEEVYQTAIEIKPHVKEASYKVESSKYNLKVAQAGYWPTLSLGLSYNNGFNHIYDLAEGYSNDPIGRQLKNNYRAVIGLSLNIPIFDRFDTRNKVRQARLDIQNQDLNLINVKLNLYKEIQQAYQNAIAAQAKYISTEKAYDAAAESFKYAEERYQIGKSTVFEYNEAQTKLITSRSEQIQAKYELVFSSKILDFYKGKEIDI